jgi:hypothetical protein
MYILHQKKNLWESSVGTERASHMLLERTLLVLYSGRCATLRCQLTRDEARPRLALNNQKYIYP